MSGKTGLLLVLIVLGAALAYSVTARLSDQTIDVIVGLACGVAASVPISVGLLIALNRHRQDPLEEDEPVLEYPRAGSARPGYSARQPYPPVIVITPQPGQILNSHGGLLPPGTMSTGYNMYESPTSRDFRIIGDDDDSFDA